MHDVMKDAESYHSLVKADEEHHTAKNYHAVMNNIYSKNKTENVNYPANETTSWMTDHYIAERTFQELQDSVYQHHLPSAEDYYNLKDHQKQQLKLEIKGVKEADALIDSGAHMYDIQQRLNELQGLESYASKA
jgi:broad specificity polyphosphatase/5'/3'-nucleotidase SurE